MSSNPAIRELLRQAFAEALDPTLDAVSDEFFLLLEQVTLAVIETTPEEFETWSNRIVGILREQSSNHPLDMSENRLRVAHAYDQLVIAYVHYVKTAVEYRNDNEG